MHADLLVKVAVIDFALPTDAEGGAAHEAVDGGGIEVFEEKPEVVFVLAVAFEVGAKAGDGHVGDGVELVEDDAEVFFHFALVVVFKFLLVAREEGAVGIIDEIEGESGVATVAEGIEALEGFDAFIEDAFSALFVDIFRGVAGHGCDECKAMFGQEVGHFLVAGFEKDGGIKAINDGVDVRDGAKLADEVFEIRDHFRSATGEVDSGDFGCVEPLENAIDRWAGDDFLAGGTRIDVAVRAGEVAELTYVELENFGFAPLEFEVPPG